MLLEHVLLIVSTAVAVGSATTPVWIRVGRVLQRLDNIEKRTTDTNKEVKQMRRDVNGKLGEQGRSLIEAQTQIANLPCRPPASHCPEDK